MFLRFRLPLIILLHISLYGIAESSTPLSDSSAIYLQHTVKKGESVFSILKQYGLLSSPCNISKFQELNSLSNQNAIYHGRRYQLPILLLHTEDLQSEPYVKKSNDILQYSERLSSAQLIEKDQIVVAHSLLFCSEASGAEPPKKMINAPILGEEYRSVEHIDESLKGQVYYLVSGHGGPDPGAMYNKNKVCLCEDEYAYDVTLRLYRNLIARGATVHMIIQDPDDGLRSHKYLKCDRDERCDQRKIPLNQLARLSQRTEYVNRLYQSYKKQGIKNHKVVIIHVDSRPEKNRQDVFFLHAKGSKKGRAMAKRLHETFKQKYRIHRKNGNYDGTVVERNLYVLKRTHPPAVYVELANIQNPRDQKRIIRESNRQTLADWLMEGLIKEK